MRRFLRPIVIAIASLGLALGAGVGLAAPALADTGFTASIEGGPILSGGTEIDFTGEKASTSAITSASINIEGDISSCQIPAGGANWSCEFDSVEAIEAGTYAAQFVETDADGTETTQVLTFAVYDPVAPTDPPLPTQPTSPLVGYQFSPGGVTVTGTPTGAGNAVGISISNTDSSDLPTTCPGLVNSDHPVGDVPQSAPVSCSTSAGDDSTLVVQSQQGTTAPTVASRDTSNGGFFIPENSLESLGAPFIVTTSDDTARTVTFTGSIQNGQFGFGIGVVVLDSNGSVACRTSDNSDSGDPFPWSCTTRTLSYGTHTFVAAVEDEGSNGEGVGIALGRGPGYYVLGGLSSSTPAGQVTFTAPVVPINGGSGITGPATPNWSFSIGGDLTNVHPGDTLTISGSGLPAATSLDTILHSVPTDLGSVVAAADGTFTQTVTIPTNTDLGDHTVLVTASGPGITTTTKQQAITVTAVPVPAADSGSSGKTDTSSTKPTATHGAGVNGSGTGIAPNILTRALTPFADVAVHPNKIISAFEIGLVLLLLAVLPAHLLNATIAEQSDRFERRFPKFRLPNWMFSIGVWLRSAPVVGGIIVTLATAILFGFADPKFGFTLASLRLILACGIALFLVGYVANALTGLIARVQWNIVAAVSTRPYGLILTIVGVLISRLLHFSPGFLIGLILGLTIQGKSAAGFAWRTVVLRSSIVLLMAIAAWIGYSTLTLGGNEGGTFGSALLVETLVAITTEGVVALLVELLPLRFLEGERIYAHSRVLWGVFYFLTLVVFVLAVVPWEGNWDALGSSLWIWIGVLALFAVVCVGIYIYFRNFAKPLEEEAGSEKVALGETVAGDRS
ncbi:MAG TPA: hypothetical protein VIJ11_05975 [Galbitalea sp.]